jgi:hypothetical protein
MKPTIATILIGLGLCMSASAQTTRLFIQEHIKTVVTNNSHCDTYGNCYGGVHEHERNVSAEATKTFMDKCPAVTITNEPSASDYTLAIAKGSSTLYNAKGDAVYASPAKFKVNNLVKDVCGYIEQHPMK